MEVYGIDINSELYFVVLFLVGIEIFTIFILLEMLLVLICMLSGNLIVVSFLVLEFGVVLYLLYE